MQISLGLFKSLIIDYGDEPSLGSIAPCNSERLIKFHAYSCYFQNQSGLKRTTRKCKALGALLYRSSEKIYRNSGKPSVLASGLRKVLPETLGLSQDAVLCRLWGSGRFPVD